jgi:hypothetical protein
MQIRPPPLLALALALLPLVSDAKPLTDAEIEAAFVVADPDRDGKVDPRESSEFGIGKKAFEVADAGHDRKLDRNRFAAAIVHQFNRAAGKGDVLDHQAAQVAGLKSKQAVMAADADGDGTLDLGEYLRALTLQAQEK